MSKQNIYDNDLFYENFVKIRSKEINKLKSKEKEDDV